VHRCIVKYNSFQETIGDRLVKRLVERLGKVGIKIVENNVNGFLVEPSRPGLLPEPVLRLLKDKALYAKMAQAGREIVVRKFSINGMADRTEELYKRVKGGGKG